MNKGWLLLGFIMLLVPAVGLALYPLRKQRMKAWLLVPVLMIAVGVAYWQWGAWPAWTHYLKDKAKQARIQAVLQSMHEPAELIDKLKATLQQQPNSARGWYLLGRIYASQNQWLDADDAFAKAHQLQPDNEQITVNYVQNLWQLHHQQFDDSSRALLKAVLEKNPNQPDALSMLAMDAYMSNEYQLAIDYWQDLLKLLPNLSDDAKAIRKAIAKAQAMMSKQ